MKCLKHTHPSLNDTGFIQWNDTRFVLDQHAELDLHSACSLKQQSVSRHIVDTLSRFLDTFFVKSISKSRYLPLGVVSDPHNIHWIVQWIFEGKTMTIHKIRGFEMYM
jgi:hypothetical protein